MSEVIITLILEGFDQKNHFSRRAVLVQGQLFGTGIRYGLTFLRQCGKRVKTKIQKFQRLFHTIVEVTAEKLVGWGGLYPPSPYSE